MHYPPRNGNPVYVEVTWVESFLMMSVHKLVECTLRRHSTYSLSKLGLKVMEDEMRECFRHCTHIWYVMSHDCVGDGEGSSWTVWKMTDHKTICILKQKEVMLRKKEHLRISGLCSRGVTTLEK